MAIIPQEMMWVLYGLLIIILAFAGYYIGGMYNYEWLGAGVGALAGVGISSGLYWYMMNNKTETMSY